MITVQLNRRDFEYDIHSLVKAFFPKEEVIVSENPPEGDTILRISVFYGDADIRICLSDEKDGSRPEKISGKTDFSDRKDTKNKLKTVLYQELCSYTGKKLPWGDLTGIRPTKIAMEKLNAGWSNPKIAQHLRETYFVSPEKSALAITIVNREKAILDRIDPEKGYSLYIGIPFCPSICLYCSFSSSPLALWKNRVDEYLDALLKEMDECCGLFSGYTLNSVYIGGGTPTTLLPHQIDRLLAHVERCFHPDSALEFTVEAGRPDTISREKLAVLRDHGISRISINPQTMNQKTLDIIGRAHTTDQIREAFFLAREMGFDNINMDTIVGLPGEGMAEVEHTMRELSAMHPDNITVHSLALKRAARLSLKLDEYRDESFVSSSEIMDMTTRICEENGLFPYYLYRQKNMAGNFENVGYAAEGKAGLYNILIMEEVQSILALGASGSTKLVEPDGHIDRIENVKDISNYIERIDEMIARKRVIPQMMCEHGADPALFA